MKPGPTLLVPRNTWRPRHTIHEQNGMLGMPTGSHPVGMPPGGEVAVLTSEACSTHAGSQREAPPGSVAAEAEQGG